MARQDFSRLSPRFTEADIRRLAARFAVAGGRRITMTEASARLVTQALGAYADMLALKRDSDESITHYRVEEQIGEGEPWVVALASDHTIGKAAFDGAAAQSPHRNVRFYRGASLLAERVAGSPPPSAPATVRPVEVKRAAE